MTMPTPEPTGYGIGKSGRAVYVLHRRPSVVVTNI
jgi:hypothetical protein